MKSNLTYLKKLELFKELDSFKDEQFFAIIDQQIKNHLPQWIAFSSRIFWLKNPEEDKNLDTYKDAIEFLLKQGITRNSTLYGIGGGATTDFSGFVASTILRGINWVAVPTTLLAIVDGSIGGKVALNMPQGKNLIGAFHAPLKVLICNDFLTTLSDKEWMSGKGEVLKYGFLSKEINQMILSRKSIEDISLACAEFKNKIVEKDFKESGDRILLNLGHTLGHAFEVALDIPHGQAVIMGMKYLFKYMEMEDALDHWEKMLKALDLQKEKFDLKDFPGFDRNRFFSYLDHDKKKSEGNIRLVLVREIGQCYVEEMSLKDFKTKIQSHADFKD